MSFKSFDLNPLFLEVLQKQGIAEPTPVQAQAIPVALTGRDVLAIAQTGTGKTLAFGLPALTRLAQGKPARNRMLVLAPTRELACQVHKSLEPHATAVGLRSVCIYGGVGMEPQTAALRRGCDLVVATPGRLLDHIGRGTVRFDKLEVLVLDEADRMLDMGFLPDIRRILSGLPAERQTLLFSATFPDEIAKLTHDFQTNVQRVEIARSGTTVDLVKQRMYTVRTDDKVDLLAKLMAEPGVTSSIVFIKTKHRTDKIAKQLSQRGIEAVAIHGGRSQGQRDRALEGFRKGRCRVLVATDVAARGLDVQGVSHVFNFDIPRTFDDYVHRIGRTGRANAKGHAVLFVSPEETKELRDIETGLGFHLTRIEWDGAVPVTSLYGQAPRSGAGRGAGQGQGRTQRSSNAAPQARRAPQAQAGGRDRNRSEGGRPESNAGRGSTQRQGSERSGSERSGSERQGSDRQTSERQERTSQAGGRNQRQDRDQPQGRTERSSQSSERSSQGRSSQERSSQQGREAAKSNTRSHSGERGNATAAVKQAVAAVPPVEREAEQEATATKRPWFSWRPRSA